MTYSSLKKEILSMLDGTEDEAVLQVVHSILSRGSKIYQLNEEQLAAVREADEQYARGEAIGQDEAEREIGEWLKD